jgi:hypothetical protein
LIAVSSGLPLSPFRARHLDFDGPLQRIAQEPVARLLAARIADAQLRPPLRLIVWQFLHHQIDRAIFWVRADAWLIGAARSRAYRHRSSMVGGYERCGEPLDDFLEFHSRGFYSGAFEQPRDR